MRFDDRSLVGAYTVRESSSCLGVPKDFNSVWKSEIHRFVSSFFDSCLQSLISDPRSTQILRSCYSCFMFLWYTSSFPDARKSFHVFVKSPWVGIQWVIQFWVITAPIRQEAAFGDIRFPGNMKWLIWSDVLMFRMFKISPDDVLVSGAIFRTVLNVSSNKSTYIDSLMRLSIIF